MRCFIPVLIATALSGCVVYDENLVYDTASPSLSDRPDDPTDGDRDTAEPLRLYPAGGLQGERLILSLYAENVDLTTVQDVTFFGDAGIEILATGSRGASEYLLTVDIAPTAPRSDNHLLIDYADGTTLFLEDAFAVVGDPAELPTGGGGPSGATCD